MAKNIKEMTIEELQELAENGIDIIFSNGEIESIEFYGTKIELAV